jgi:hypothetical protein
MPSSTLLRVNDSSNTGPRCGHLRPRIIADRMSVLSFGKRARVGAIEAVSDVANSAKRLQEILGKMILN